MEIFLTVKIFYNYFKQNSTVPCLVLISLNVSGSLIVPSRSHDVRN